MGGDPVGRWVAAWQRTHNNMQHSEYAVHLGPADTHEILKRAY